MVERRESDIHDEENHGYSSEDGGISSS